MARSNWTPQENGLYVIDKGGNADMEQQNYASATQGILIDAAMPVLREEITSPLSPFRYKDELEKALNDFHFGNMFTNGA